MPLPRIQADFFSRVADHQSIRKIFEHIPGMFFFIKDDGGRFITANRATCVRCGLKTESDLIGFTDADFLPPDIAKAYRADDEQVIRSGNPIIDRLELFYDEQRRLEWFLTTKLPLLDRKGKVIGVMGLARRDDKREIQHDIRELSEATRFARENCLRVATACEMAKAAGLSERHLQRKLQASLGISPYELLLRNRIRSAAQSLVESSKSITEIALDHGFCDQSAFTRQFRKKTGFTPREFRLTYKGVEAPRS